MLYGVECNVPDVSGIAALHSLKGQEV